MKSRSNGLCLLHLLLISLWLSACGPTEAQVQATSTQIAADIFATLTASAPTPTLAPRPTSTPIPTPTPAFDAFVNVPSLRIYAGPAVTYAPVADLSMQDGLIIKGRDRDCNWLNIAIPQEGWVNTQFGRVTLNSPCETFPHGFYRPENGAIMIDKRENYGTGKLEVDNGYLQDIHVVLTYLDSNLSVYSIYIHSQEQAALVGIPDGEYNIYYSSGTNWDGVDYGFTSNATYRKFEDSIAFTTKKFPGWKLTLNPVEGGTAKTDIISPNEFPSLGD
jgi:hypothetical protein